MTSAQELDPLASPPPIEVPLPQAPLVRVIAQVRFPIIVSIEKKDFIAEFQEQVRADYPVLRIEQARRLVLDSRGTAEEQPTLIWRFHDAGGSWRASLAPDFVALETEAYDSRDDFLARLERLLRALDRTIDPRVVDRLGIRYVDRVTGGNLVRLPELVRDEIVGVTSLCAHTKHSLSDSLFVLPDGSGNLAVRWGLLPAHGSTDPTTIEPIDEPSWILDLDCYAQESRTMDVDALIAQARGFSERIYTFFRWVVNDEFLRAYGGQP